MKDSVDALIRLTILRDDVGHTYRTPQHDFCFDS